MLTDPKLRSQVDALWDKFWTGGLTNPLDAIEQFSYLLFLKRLDDRENAAERQAKRKGTAYQAQVKKEMRWSVWKQMKAEEMLKHLKSVVFPQLASLTDEASSFGIYMRGAECKINKPSLLVEAVNLKVPVAQRSGIDQMEINQQNQDVQGDLYEYLLSHLSIAGRNGLSLQEEFAGVVAQVESLRGRMSEAGRQVEGLFESLLEESFGG